MADESIASMKPVNNITTDIPEGPPVYPGKPLKSVAPPPQQTGVVEQPNTPNPANIATERPFNPVASVKYPEKDIQVAPVSNTKVRGLKPVGLSGSVVLPIKGERLVSLEDDIRKPLETRLGRLVNPEEEQEATPSQLSEITQQLGAQLGLGRKTGDVKTELDKLRALARSELSKTQAPVKKGVQSAIIQPKQAEQLPQPATQPAIIQPGQAEQTPQPIAQSQLVKTAQPITSPPPALNPEVNASAGKLLTEASSLQKELSTLQQSLTRQEEQRKEQVEVKQQEDYYISQINQLVADKTELLNKMNELAAAYQGETTKLKQTEGKFANLTNNFNMQLQKIQNEKNQLLIKIQNVEQERITSQEEKARADELAKQVESLKNQLAASEKVRTSFQNQIQKLELLVKQVDRRKKIPTEKAPPSPMEVRGEKKEAASARVVRPQIAVGKMAPSLTNAPNVINGIVKDAKGMLLSNVVLVVKSDTDEPVRALKTNKIGQFAISTPLPNGTYTMELESFGHSFDLIQIEVKGDVLPPIEIRAHN
jgi:hypothetical protein